MIQRHSITYILAETYGNPPHQGGGTCVGAPGETLDEIQAYLLAIYGDRIQTLEPTHGQHPTHQTRPVRADPPPP